MIQINPDFKYLLAVAIAKKYTTWVNYSRPNINHAN